MNDWERFEASVLAGAEPIADLVALQALGFADRNRAIALLKERISAGDHRAAHTALAGDVTEITTMLRDCGATIPRDTAARALVLFRDSDPLVSLVALLEWGHVILRGNAAFDLGMLEAPAATDALLTALTDEGTTVRVHAWNGLVRHLHLKSFVEPRHSPLGVLFLLLVSDVPGSVVRGRVQFTQLVSRLRQGSTPTMLKLDAPAPPDDEHVSAFVASMRDLARPIDVIPVQRMTPMHREWAVAMIVAAAGHPDPRARVAIEALAEPWALEAIETLPR